MEKINFTIENDVLHGPFPEGIEMDLDTVKQMVRDRMAFLNGRELVAMVDTTGVKSVTKEAQDYMGSDEAAEGIIAAAILSRSLFSKFVSNFFIKVSLIKCPIPVRVFTDQQEALKWLEQFK